MDKGTYIIEDVWAALDLLQPHSHLNEF